MCARSDDISEVIRGVGDPVGSLIFGAFGRTVGREQGFECLRLLLHLLDGPLGGGLCQRLGVSRGSRGSGHSYEVKRILMRKTKSRTKWKKKKCEKKLVSNRKEIGMENRFIRKCRPTGHLSRSVFKFKLKKKCLHRFYMSHPAKPFHKSSLLTTWQTGYTDYWPFRHLKPCQTKPVHLKYFSFKCTLSKNAIRSHYTA